MLKFLVDHNVPKSVSDFLRKQKYDVKLVKDVNSEMTDIHVLDLAKKEKRIIVSNDKDFIGLSVKYDNVDMILFNYFSQLPDVRISGLKKIFPKIASGFGLLILS